MERDPRGSRYVQVVRGYAEDDGVRLVFGIALLVAGPSLARLVGDVFMKIGILEPRRGRERT